MTANAAFQDFVSALPSPSLRGLRGLNFGVHVAMASVLPPDSRTTHLVWRPAPEGLLLSCLLLV
jgi:hypothetical protein